MTPATPATRCLSRDQRIECQALRKAGQTYAEIAKLLGHSQRAVQNACTSRVTPQHKKKGRRASLTDEEGDKIEELVIGSDEGRRMTYQAIADHLWPDGSVSAAAVRYQLVKRGYARRTALQKPALTEKHKKERLKWAEEHLNWSEEQWWSILWSDETWVTRGSHRRSLVTLKKGEELLSTCVDLKKQRKKGWMFWACFSGDNAGPHLYWEKEWGTVTSERYCQQVIPLVHGWLQFFPELQFMHDNAPAHSAYLTADQLKERDIPVIFWPALSPDLNPIEHLWNILKDWLQQYYPDPNCTEKELHSHVIEAWYTIATPEQLSRLVYSMKQRCVDVIAAQGGHTRW